MLRRLALICTLVALSASSQDLHRCPKGVHGFAGPTDVQYYDCRKGGEFAELLTCEDGMVYDYEVAGCSEPLAKRESVESKVKVALGEAIKIGTLYDERNSRMYSGYGLYSKKTLEEFTKKTTGKYSDNQDIYIEASSKMSRAKFGLGASLELEFLSGLIKVSGSAEYIKDDVKKSNTARVVMKKEIEGDIHELNVHGADISTDYCDLVSENSGPTHVITRVVYGQRAYMVFEKDASLVDNTESLKGSLHATIDMIPDLVIEGHVAIHVNGSDYKNDDKMTVKFYGDAILDSVPRSWIGAIDTFNKVLKIEEGDELSFQSPIKYELTPLKTVCKNPVDAKIRQITQDLINTAIELLSNLKNHMKTADYLLSTDPAIRYTAIKQQLVIFKTNLDAFYAKMAAKVAHVLPLIKAKKAEESVLSDIIVELQNSPYVQERSNAFLDQRSREIKTILKITADTLKSKDVQLSDIVSATDNECIFKSKLATVFVLNLLPDLDLATRFIANEGKWSEKDSWINDRGEVKSIGYAKQRFDDYVKANIELTGEEKKGDRCYMLKLDMLDTENKFNVQLYREGTQISDNFEPPPIPEMAKCGIDFADGFAITTQAAESNYYRDVTGIRVHTRALTKQFESEQDVENDSSVRVRQLLPDEYYQIKYRYIVQKDHGFSGPSQVKTCRTLPTSAPTALMASENDASSFKLSWAKPDIVAHHLIKDYTITYEILVGNTKKADVTGLTKHISSLQAGTAYTVTVTPKINGSKGKPAVLTAVTAPAAPAAPVPGQVQDNRARFAIKVGDVRVPTGATKELLSIKYFKLQNNQPVSGSTVYYMQRLQGEGNTEIDIASFETGTTYGVQVKLLVRYGERFLGTEYSSKATITTTTEGSPIDNLRDNINTFESSSKQNLDTANAQKDSLTATLTSAENKFNSAKSGGLQKITDMSGAISNNFASIQKKSNALQKSKCVVDGYWFWSYAQNRLGTVTAKSLPDCLAKCADKDGCSSSSFKVSTNGGSSGSCEMFTKRMGDMLFSQTNYYSANLYCQINDAATIDTWNECVKKGTAYSGSDIKSSGGINSIEECVAFGQTVDGCQSVTYTKSSKTCNVKSKRKGDSVSSSSDKVSVTMACLSANRGGVSRCANENLRFTDSVIQITSQNSLDLCIQYCSYKDGCESVSYRASSKTCEAHNKRLGASRRSEGGWTSVNIYCLGLQYF